MTLLAVSEKISLTFFIAIIPTPKEDNSKMLEHVAVNMIFTMLRLINAEW
jgi:hypothetical protein